MFPIQTIGNCWKIQFKPKELRGSKQTKQTNKQKETKKENLKRLKGMWTKCFLVFCISIFFEFILFIQMRGSLVNHKLIILKSSRERLPRGKENGSEIKSCQVQRITCRHYIERPWEEGGQWISPLRRNKAHNNISPR